MASSTTNSYDVCIPDRVIPTVETKVKLGDKILITPLVVGTWAWGDQQIWTWNEELNGKAKEAFEAFIAKGINTFDTAEVYGDGESERSLTRYRTDGNKDAVIFTKYFPYFTRLRYPSSLITALRASLERLQVDCVDLYQIHGPILLRSIKVTANALAEAVKLGLTRTVGVSNYSTKEMITMYECLKKHGIQLGSSQIEFSLLQRSKEVLDHIAECHKRGVTVLGYGPLAMGRLTGKYSNSNPFPPHRSYLKITMDEIEPLIETMRGIANEHNVSITSVALNYVICKGVVPVCGSRDVKQAEENASALGWRLTTEEIDQLESHQLDPQNMSLFRFW